MSVFFRIGMVLFYLQLCCYSAILPAASQEGATGKTEEPSSSVSASAREYTTEAGRRIEVVLSGLKYPCGVAIQPETGSVFVSDSGSGQVIRVDGGQSVPVITEIPLAPLQFDLSIRLGPLGLLFADKNSLLVACGGQENGEAILRRFQFTESAEPMKSDAAQFVQRFAPAENQANEPAMLYSLTATLEAFYGSVVQEDQSGWIVEHKKSKEITAILEPYLDVAESQQTGRPAGLCMSPHGYLVVGTIGQWDGTNDAKLSFYDTVTKKLLMSLDTGLHDISAVAYSPRKQMYALDLSVAHLEEGGLYRIIADESSSTGMKHKKIASLDHPTAMVFDAEGSLYVTLAGQADEQGDRQGLLLKIPSEENL